MQLASTRQRIVEFALTRGRWSNTVPPNYIVGVGCIVVVRSANRTSSFVPLLSRLLSMLRLACPWLFAVCCACAPGCAQWAVESADPLQAASLPNSKLAPDSVVVQIAVLRVPEHLEDSAHKIWDQIDEQHLSNDQRRRLRQNGIRSGVVGSHLPDQLQQILDSEQAENPEAAEEELRKTATGTWHERKQTRTGRRYKIVTTEARPRIDTMTNVEGVLHGKTCLEAHCELALRTYPQPDGSVRIELTPEVYYGKPKQTYTPGSFGFVYETVQEHLDFDNLKIEAVLAPGQTLLTTATPERVGLGQHFFSHPDNPQRPTKLVLVRLAQTQHDDLFDPGQIVSPVATPTE